jgi:hypothetical protein
MMHTSRPLTEMRVQSPGIRDTAPRPLPKRDLCDQVLTT